MDSIDWQRRQFLQALALASGGLTAWRPDIPRRAFENPPPTPDQLAVLPEGSAPKALALPHFPSRLHAFVWRNWQLVPVDRLAAVVGARRGDLLDLARRIGLGDPPAITRAQQARSYITVIRRNWHLLPYEQLLTLLGWTREELAFTLREDDFLFHKLGFLKPKCEPLTFTVADAAVRQREAEIRTFIGSRFPEGLPAQREPLFGFVDTLSSKAPASREPPRASTQLRFCYSYFALYGDPLLDNAPDSYPDGYLARLVACGVNGVWLQAVLDTLAPAPWLPERSARRAERLKNLRALVARAARHGIRIYLYLNEPRALPVKFFETHPDLKGIVEGEDATLCTSLPAVRAYLADGVESICRAVPDLGGFFTITASENLTNCWSHDAGKACPRCGTRTAGEVIAEVNATVARGIQRAGGRQRLLAWDWGWADAWVPEIIRRLPPEVALMSVSEWDLPIERGGIKSRVGEYSISSVGPGPRARRHWQMARDRGLQVVAKIQASNTWELSAVPYIPAVALIAEHAKNLRAESLDGLMLGWTLGGYPSPNLETVAEVLAGGELSQVARRRYGDRLAPAVVKAWEECSEAFRQFPFEMDVVYSAPLQSGPSNLLWEKPTSYGRSIVGFAYDDLDTWRSIYPVKVFIDQLEKVASGFVSASQRLQNALTEEASRGRSPETQAATQEHRVMRAAALHFQSAANQCRFVDSRRALAAQNTLAGGEAGLEELARLLRAEMDAARDLWQLQVADSRIGFEATNHYFYVPMDLVEKMLNCHDLLTRWLPEERKRRAPAAHPSIDYR